MSLTTLLPVLAGILFLISLAVLAIRMPQPDSQSGPARAASKSDWLLPAGLSFCFLAFSLFTVYHEGGLGFVAEHTRNLWGNQITFDLLLAAGVAWFLLLPQARAQGMRPLPWLVLIVSTGSIGILAMLARLLYLQSRPERALP